MAVSFHTAEGFTFRFTGRRTVAAWLRESAAGEGKHCRSINIILCPDDYLLAINRQFLGHDYYTDVITFDYTEGTAIAGDIYISVDTVSRNAAEYGTTSRRELLRVMVHGVLHLCGYGDKTPGEERIMHAKEDLYLMRLEEK